MSDPIESLMRESESKYSYRIPDNTWIIMRLDGRSFSGMTEQHFVKPFDSRFHGIMVQTAKSVMTDLQACFAYVGSDEISLIFLPTYTSYDRRVEKLLSISAGIASGVFTQESNLLVQFDSRINALETINEVLTYCLWRNADVQHNSLSTLTYWTLRGEGMSPRQVTAQLKEAGRSAKIQMLQQRSIVFEAITPWQRGGIGIAWEAYEKQGFDPIKGTNVLAQRRRLTEIEIGDAYSDWLASYLGASLGSSQVAIS